MKKKYLSEITDLALAPFTIENITMMRSYVEPPALFRIKKGQLTKSRFFYVIKGTMIAKKSGTEILRATKGSLIYLPSDIIYESEWLTDATGEYLTFECNLISKENNELMLGNEMFLIVENDKSNKYLNTMTKMYDFYQSQSVNAPFRFLSEIYLFLSLIVSHTLKNKYKNDVLTSDIYKGIIYINENYCSDITIGELARLCNVGESTFRRKFNEHFGMSPTEYIGKLKLQRAKELLISEIYNIDEISNSLNFYDTSHFINFFKKHCGITPRQFLKKHKNIEKYYF